MMTAKDKYICEQLGWVYSENDGYVELSQASPAGEDFNICVNSKNFVEEVQDYAASFDPEEHVSMWAEAKNNGVGGVPSLFDLVEDAKAIDKMLEDLACALSTCDVFPIDVHVGYAFTSSEDVFDQENKLASEMLNEIADVCVVSETDFKDLPEEKLADSQVVITYRTYDDYVRYKIHKGLGLSDLELLLAAGANLKYGFCRNWGDEYLVFTRPDMDKRKKEEV